MKLKKNTNAVSFKYNENMFDELAKYKNNNHFFFTAKEELQNVCNAPKDKSGIYIVYELKNGRNEFYKTYLNDYLEYLKRNEN